MEHPLGPHLDFGHWDIEASTGAGLACATCSPACGLRGTDSHAANFFRFGFSDRTPAHHSEPPLQWRSDRRCAGSGRAPGGRRSECSEFAGNPLASLDGTFARARPKRRRLDIAAGSGRAPQVARGTEQWGGVKSGSITRRFGSAALARGGRWNAMPPIPGRRWF